MITMNSYGCLLLLLLFELKVVCRAGLNGTTTTEVVITAKNLNNTTQFTNTTPNSANTTTTISLSTTTPHKISSTTTTVSTTTAIYENTTVYYEDDPSRCPGLNIPRLEILEGDLLDRSVNS